MLMALDRRTVRQLTVGQLDNDASDTGALRQFVRQYAYIDYTADDWIEALLYALPRRGMGQVLGGRNEPENEQDDDVGLLPSA